MARIPRLLNIGEATIYHVMSRTALEGFPLDDVEKDYLLELIKTHSQLYFVDILGFSLMGNHFHLMVKVHPEFEYTDDEVRRKVLEFYKDDRIVTEVDILKYRDKLGSLSEFMKDIKQGFTRYYNKKNKRFGYFWGQRFKSIIVENGETLANCLAYIDLNPVRAGIVEKPEDYRWNTSGYLLQTDNSEDFLSMEFGLPHVPHEEKLSVSDRIEHYRRFVYEIGSLAIDKGKSIDKSVVEEQEKKGYKITKSDRFKYRTRYFIDSGVIGSKQFVSEQYQKFQDSFQSKRSKNPVPIQGLDGCFSLKRLALNG